MQRLSRNRLLAATAVTILSAATAIFWSAGANADEKPDRGEDPHSETVEGGLPEGSRIISSLDDLDGIPCNTASDNPGTVQLDYGMPLSGSSVAIFCQVGDPKLTISIDTDSLVTFPGDEVVTSGGRVTADPPGSVCDSADLEAGMRSCEPIEYQEGDVVTLTVEPDAVSSFAGWVEIAGTCQGTRSPCSFTMERDERVSATFRVASGL